MNWPEDFVDKVICGDCLEIMKQLPDACIDLIQADPPYNFKHNSNYSKVEAKLLKRHFIGIEIKESYCEISRERLAQEVL